MITEERVERMLFKIKKETVMMLTVSFFYRAFPKGKKTAGELPFSRRYTIGDVKNELGFTYYILARE